MFIVHCKNRRKLLLHICPQEKEPHVIKRKRKRNELKPEIVAVLHTVKNYNIIEPPLCETRKQDRSDKRIFG